MTISVLLAEDNEIIRKMIADLLKNDPAIEVIGQCATFAQTLDLASKLHPEVVLLDVHTATSALSHDRSLNRV
jgi:chemotaxis response regulator CheB